MISSSALAAPDGTDPFGTSTGQGVAGVSKQPFDQVIVQYINYFLGFLGIIAVAFIIYAGVLMVTAQGEQEALDKGKKVITWAAIGIIIIMLSYAIVRVITGAAQTTL